MLTVGKEKKINVDVLTYMEHILCLCFSGSTHVFSAHLGVPGQQCTSHRATMLTLIDVFGDLG